MNREEFLKSCAQKKDQWIVLTLRITAKQNDELKDQAKKYGVRKADYIRSRLFYEDKQ